MAFDLAVACKLDGSSRRLLRGEAALAFAAVGVVVFDGRPAPPEWMKTKNCRNLNVRLLNLFFFSSREVIG